MASAERFSVVKHQAQRAPGHPRRHSAGPAQLGHQQWNHQHNKPASRARIPQSVQAWGLVRLGLLSRSDQLDLRATGGCRRAGFRSVLRSWGVSPVDLGGRAVIAGTACLARAGASSFVRSHQLLVSWESSRQIHGQGGRSWRT